MGIIGELGTKVKDGIIGTLKGVDEIYDAIFGTVRDNVVDALKGAGDVSSAAMGSVEEIVTGAIEGVTNVGQVTAEPFVMSFAAPFKVCLTQVVMLLVQSLEPLPLPSKV